VATPVTNVVQYSCYCNTGTGSVRIIITLPTDFLRTTLQVQVLWKKEKRKKIEKQNKNIPRMRFRPPFEKRDYVLSLDGLSVSCHASDVRRQVSFLSSLLIETL
jgi:hypothetical protein